MKPDQIQIGKTYQTRRIGRYRANRAVTDIRDVHGIMTAFYHSVRNGISSEIEYRMPLNKFAEGCLHQLGG